MRAGEGLCFSIGDFPVYSPQFDWHCVSRAHRLGCMYLFWKSSHTCYRKSALDRSQRSGVIPARCSKRLFSRQGLIYFSAFYSSSSLYDLCWAYVPRPHSLPQFMPRLTNVPSILRSLLVSHCKRCPEYVMYDSLLQHSCVHAHLKYDVEIYRVLLFLSFSFRFACAWNNTVGILSVRHFVAFDTGWYPAKK